MEGQTKKIDVDDLRNEVQKAVALFMRRQHDLKLVPEVEVGPLEEYEGPFPTLTATVKGEIFFSAPRRRLREKGGGELDAALARLQEGFQLEQILEGRLRSATCTVDRQKIEPVFADGGPDIVTLAGWLRLDVHW